MDITTYSDFRQNLKSYLDKVFLNHDPLFVKRSRGEDVVVISKADYSSMQETLHLLSHPKNVQRLSEGIKKYEEGDFHEKGLLK